MSLGILRCQHAGSSHVVRLVMSMMAALALLCTAHQSPLCRDPSVGQPPLCDWWGRPDSIVHRNSVRYSVIFAFGHSEPQRFPSSWLGGNQY